MLLRYEAHQLRLGISPEGICAVGMALNFTVAAIVAKFTPEPPQYVQ